MKEIYEPNIFRNEGIVYLEGESEPYTGEIKIYYISLFFRKRKLKSIKKYKDGKLVKYTDFYRNGKKSIEHVLGQAPKRWFSNGSRDRRPEINHR